MQADLARLGRIAIVNRGEPAMRAIHAVRELAAEHDVPLRTIALHTDAERGAMFVREADEAQRIGPAPGATPVAGRPTIAYLDHDGLLRALRACRADSVWVGWGFVAEDAHFAARCRRAGITFVGPSPEAMRELGDKIWAKRLAEQAGVPVAAWSGGPVEDVDAAMDHGRRIGAPLVVKAAAGGGGRGIRIVHDLGELPIAFERAREEARHAFGDPTLFMESLVTGARHIEVQVIADQHGTVWPVGVRDCSVQRRSQKVLEESASSVLDPGQIRDLSRAACDLVRAAGYTNAGTVEFLYRPVERTFAFLEVNTRLQVEHPVTELTTGVDLVKLQLHVAAGGHLEGEVPAERGHAIEVRLNAEDPQRGFAPSPGRIERLVLPVGPGVRVDTGVAEGDTIPSEYDSMIAKIITHGRDRSEAQARMRRALSQTTVLIRDGTTNRAFLLELLRHPDLTAGQVDTTWLDRLAGEGLRFPERADVALVAAAIDAYDAAASVARDRFFASAARGRPQVGTDTGVVVDLRHGGVPYRIDVHRTGASTYLVGVDDVRVTAEVEPLGPFVRHLTVAGRRHRVTAIAQGADQLVEVDGVPHRVSQDDAGLVRTPGPSVVVAVTVRPGDEVTAGQSVAVVESMKMETVLAAPFAGRVAEVLVAGNVQLDAGAPVVRLEPLGDGTDEEVTSERVSLVGLVGTTRGTGAADDPAGRALAGLDALRLLTLGYDVPDDQVEPALEALRATAPGDPRLLAAELAVLRAFSDQSSLTRNRRIGDAEDDHDAHASREYLHAYLRSLDVEAEGLPESFQERLRRALTHHGITSLERTPALEEALYRIHLAQQRLAVQVPVILALLERRLEAPAPDDRTAGELRDTLDRLILATQVRHPVIGDLARRVRYRALDQPRLTRRRDEVYARAREHLRVLANERDPRERQRRITALVGSTEPLLTLLAEPVTSGRAMDAMLEVLTRRYYRTRTLTEVRATERDRLRAVVADSTDRRGRGRVVSVSGTLARLDAAVAYASELNADVPTDHASGAVADLYLTREAPAGDVDELAALLDGALRRTPTPAALRRVTLSVITAADPRERDGRATLDHLTFRREGEGFVEQRHVRGIHPLIAGRLDLWRLSRFDLRRLPSTGAVYLFEATARETPEDRRIFALAEVLDLTPIRDASGAVTALPELERVLAACLDDLRAARATYPPEVRPDWNRVVLNVWPEANLAMEELDGLVRSLAPTTDGLGLEQVAVQARLPQPGGEPVPVTIRIQRAPGQGVSVRVTSRPTRPMEPFDAATQKILRARRRGAIDPSEIVPLLVRSPDASGVAAPEGTFVEHDLDEQGELVAVPGRPLGGNAAGIVVGVVTTPTTRYPEGMRRVALFGDPTKGLGSLAEPECRRIVAALDLAERLEVPVEWFAVSSGARISMSSGTENLDWVARVLRRIVEFTQAGREINVIVTGINVGAQPYFNAEATMLMHTRGILVMTPESAMVLTGKQALDYSGGVSAEDNFGIGGYDRVMGPNGQAQYWAPDLAQACDILFSHYDHAYVAPGERFPRRATTDDPVDRDVRDASHEVEGLEFTTVGDIFSEVANPDRKKPFDIRALLHGVADADHPPLERWRDMADAQVTVVLDAHLGGWPVTLLGVESHPLPRHGPLPADGPETWSAGTLFPRASKKLARAINAASSVRPVVILANLSGFDGSPESLRQLQLEYGAEIGRAVVNFDGPIVFCVVSRYHGGAFVVFSAALNDHMEVAAVEGSHASVIGGPPAAAVVFAGEVDRRTDADPRVAELAARIARAGVADAARLRAELAAVRDAVRSEKLGEVADEFDAVHSVQRAQEVGSVHTIIPAAKLRPYLVDAVERGIRRLDASAVGLPDTATHPAAS